MYGHPYQPYDVQIQFMTALYDTLSQKKAGIFESPTGTGKTLSLLCPSLAWLRNASERQLQAALAEIDSSGGPEWARQAAKRLKREEFEARKRKQPDEPEIDADVPAHTGPKIFFVSRTHSQLAQVAEALQRIKVEPLPRFVTLGSRKQLCVHSDVRRLGSVELMNEKCADLQKSPGGCSFKNNTAPLTAEIEHSIMDIEDLYRQGQQEHACPYYATREAVPRAEIVAVPYPILLVEQNRESVGIDLRDSVVIIDEAHNLVDALTSLHSATLTLNVVERALHGLRLYLQRLGTKLGPDNKRRVMQITKLVESIQHYFIKSPEAARAKPGTPLKTSDLFAFGNADTLDLMALNAFVQESKLVFKIESYTKQEERHAADSVREEQRAAAPSDSSAKGPANSLGILFSFVMVATNPLYEGRLYHDFNEDDKTGKKQLALRYLALDPAPLFEGIVTDAQCVVMAGGTMEPMADFTTYLLPENTEVGQYSYGHIVPKSQLLVAPVSDLRFTFANRGNPQVIADLGRCVLQIARTTPNGVVVFFPGYGYLAQVVTSWQETGVWNQLKQHKRVFYESNHPGVANRVDIFSEYAKHIGGQGALLLAVVGGRLSEGINFSDDLARAVVMVGLPFPNAMSAEMVAKRQFIEQSSRQRGDSPDQAKENARQYYENMAMRAVNQSVGRAIRHIGDYAAIYLVDARYKLPEVQAKLSKWVRDSIDGNVDEEKIKAFWATNKTG